MRVALWKKDQKPQSGNGLGFDVVNHLTKKSLQWQ